MNAVQSISTRRTDKVLCDPAQPLESGGPTRDLMDELIAVAGNAPFHYPSNAQHHDELSACVPWRAYKLDTDTCRVLMKRLLDAGDTTKIPNMLAASCCLVQVTWLPDPDAGEDNGCLFAGTQRNMEHVAAASAFVQSLLVAATEAGVSNLLVEWWTFARRENLCHSWYSRKGKFCSVLCFCFLKMCVMQKSSLAQCAISGGHYLIGQYGGKLSKFHLKICRFTGK